MSYGSIKFLVAVVLLAPFPNWAGAQMADREEVRKCYASAFAKQVAREYSISVGAAAVQLVTNERFQKEFLQAKGYAIVQHVTCKKTGSLKESSSDKAEFMAEHPFFAVESEKCNAELLSECYQEASGGDVEPDEGSKQIDDQARSSQGSTAGDTQEMSLKVAFDNFVGCYQDALLEGFGEGMSARQTREFLRAQGKENEFINLATGLAATDFARLRRGNKAEVLQDTLTRFRSEPRISSRIVDCINNF